MFTRYVLYVIDIDELLDHDFTTCKPLLDVGLLEVYNQWPQSTTLYTGIHFRGSHVSCTVPWLLVYLKSDCATSDSCHLAYQCLSSNTRHSQLPDSTLFTTCQYTCHCKAPPCQYLFVDVKRSLKYLQTPPPGTFMCEVVSKPGNVYFQVVGMVYLY